MILVPIGHERLGFRRLPWVTLFIAAICVAIQVWAWGVEGSAIERAETLSRELSRVEAELERACSRQPSCRAALDAAPLAELVETHVLGSPRARARFLELHREVEELFEGHPVMALGYVPAEGAWWKIFTAMFVHGGLFHLLGNMLFLYVTGLSMEDRWGRWRFLALYLSGGVVATVSYGFVHPDSSMPLVGASGAIAAVMGAFMVLFTTTRIRFFYLFWILLFVRSGTFFAPAWIVLPLWLLQQFWMVSAEVAGLDTVAYSAHIGGFGFGALAAGAFALAGRDAHWRRSTSVAAGEWFEAPELAEGRERLAAKDPRGALRALRPLLERTPDDLEGNELAAEAAEQLQSWRSVQRHLLRVIPSWRAERPGEIIRAFHRVSRLADGPLDPRLLEETLDASVRTLDVETAKAAAQRVGREHAQHPALARALWSLGVVHQRTGQFEAARAFFERLERDHAGSPWAARAR